MTTVGPGGAVNFVCVFVVISMLLLMPYLFVFVGFVGFALCFLILPRQNQFGLIFTLFFRFGTPPEQFWAAIYYAFSWFGSPSEPIWVAIYMFVFGF